MNDLIYPRSPRETMDGWIHLPRYNDKIRLHLAGRLHPDYQPNFGQVCDWVRQNVKESAAGKAAHREFMLNRPAPDDAAGQERLRQRKAESGLAGRDDVKCFVDLLDADENRT